MFGKTEITATILPTVEKMRSKMNERQRQRDTDTDTDRERES